MNWLLAVIIGHLLNAVSYVLDKVLLTKSITNAFAFTFWVGVLGLASVAMIPFGFDVPSAGLILLNAVTGILFIAALLFFFLALQGAVASRIVPFIGGTIPVLTLVFELLFLEPVLTPVTLVAFGILVFGTVLIAIDFDTRGENTKQKQGARAWVYALIAALLFAVSFGMTKIAFESQNFFSAFVWMRWGSFLFPATFLLWKKQRRAIVESAKLFREKAGALYLLAQAFGGAGFIFINYAVSLASVSLVNALQGIQYAFLLIMAFAGSIVYPKLLHESMSKKSLAVKSVAVVVIGIGLYMISVYAA